MLGNNEGQQKKIIMNIVKKLMLSLVAFWWFIRFEKRDVAPLLFVTDLQVPDTDAMRKFAAKWQGIGIYKLINFVFCKVTYKGNNRSGQMIIAMALPNPNQVVRGVLQLTGDNRNATVVLGRQIIFDCTDNANVTVTTGLLTAATTSVNNYEGARGAEVHEFYRDMIDAFEPILALFNTFVKIPANRSHAISTLQSGGFHVVGTGGRHVAVFGVRNSMVAGEFLLTGDVDPDGAVGIHDWWYSLDNILWTRMRPTKNNHTKMGGFIRGQLVYFRHELITEDVDNPHVMSDPIARTAQ